MKHVVTCILILLAFQSQSQDLFHPKQRIQYGKNLMERYRYNAAITEFQAISTTDNNRDTAVALWYDCLIFLGRTQPAGLLLDSVFGSLTIKKKYHHSLFYSDSLPNLHSFSSKTHPTQSTIRFYQTLQSLSKHRQWDEPPVIQWEMVSEPWQTALERWYSERLRFEPKKPWTAGLLSLVPGGGQFYVGNKADAFMALTTVGIFAFQTYRGHQLRGWKHGYTITFGVLTAGFYLGNIYGGQAAAKRYNAFHLEEFDARLKSISSRFSAVD
jgi:hypothetical protein